MQNREAGRIPGKSAASMWSNWDGCGRPKVGGGKACAQQVRSRGAEVRPSVPSCGRPQEPIRKVRKHARLSTGHLTSTTDINLDAHGLSGLK